MTNDTSTSQSAYPLPEPGHADPRLTYGLLFDIADALQRNGFPRPVGTDWANLMTALGHFLYQPKEIS
ncbi:hypothetical protein [Micromonospora sp. NPDC050200]|uniref:hypothetical protein n=1 Tax=Micromonospora sp. NPDC050200 TaxID=3155664 RepID=UPI0033C7FE9D